MQRDFWAEKNSRLLEFLTNLSGLSTLGSNRAQLLSLFDSLLADLTGLFHGISSYIQFQIPSKAFENNTFRRSYGIPLEYCFNLNKVTIKQMSSILDTNFQYQFNVDGIEESRYYEGIKMLGIKSIISVPILGTDKSLATFNIYYSDPLPISPQMISGMHTLAELLATTFISTNSQVSVIEEVLERNEFFTNTYDYVFVLDNDYNLKDVNKRGSVFIGTSIIQSELNFTSLMSSQSSIDTFYSIVKSLVNGEYSTEEIMRLSSPTVISETITLAMGFTKFTANNSIFYIASGRAIDTESTPKEANKNVNADENILRQISDFIKQYSVNSENAIDKYIDSFFPAAFSLTVNEITGPIVLTSSPVVDKWDILQEVIKLMASLNIEQMLSQTFTTGSNPWSNPPGDLHWIAFTINNPNARGGIETHVLGVVARQHLITSRPTLLQSLLGNLMSGMNDVRSIILGDEADFVTSEYDEDRNFSTISLIKESLKYIRHIAMELLGSLNSSIDF